MSLVQNTKLKASDTDSDDEDEAQMRLFLEAADHTLLTNDMYQKPTQTTNSIQAPPHQKPRSERYLEEQSTAAASDLQISKEMQTHIWGKLSTIIADQIEYCASSGSSAEETPWFSQVKLVSHADCYVVDDIEPASGPQKKPTIKRRQPAAEEGQWSEAKAFASVAVSGDSILSGKETQAWAPRRVRNAKLFKYKACDKLGHHQLQAIELTNEFTKLRRSNGWNETKISQRFGNKRKQKL